jgi:SOS response regulatory protein OraA/RecX
VSADPEFGELDNATLAALVFELASQLHVERTRRLALEAALASAGIVTAANIEAAGEDASFRDQAAKAADLAIRKLLRVLSESPDERVPLRAEAPRIANGENL